jgi:hypothetical protein
MEANAGAIHMVENKIELVMLRNVLCTQHQLHT